MNALKDIVTVLNLLVNGGIMAVINNFDVNINVLKWAEIGSPGNFEINFFVGNPDNNLFSI
ncbi:MAG: hypothetical protein ACOC4G_06560 [Bacillota bacterium]